MASGRGYVAGVFSTPRCARHVLSIVVVALVVLALTGCQVKLDVHTKVKGDGSGTVQVALGLYAEALAKVGDLNSQLRVDDLRAAGWSIEGPDARDDGFTWVSATKAFADAAGATEVMDEVNGADGAFRQWTVTRSSSPLSASYTVNGTIDLTKGMQTFGDDQLSQLLGGDPFAAGVAKLEQEQGRPLSDMVDVQVTVETPGGSRTFTPTLADQEPTMVKVSTSSTNWVGVLLALLVVGCVVLVVVVILLRRRAVRIRRQRQTRVSSR